MLPTNELAQSYIFEPKPKARTSLRDEMSHLRHNWQREGLPFDWRYLDGIGFHTRTQVDMLYASIDGIVDPAVKQIRINEWIRQTEQDIKGFNLEYLAEGLTFPIYYRQEIVDGHRTIVAPLYGNKPMIELTSEKERNGVVKATLVKKIEPYLLYAQDGSIAVMTSPAGWSGLVMENGEEITYPDSQTYIWQKKGPEVVGFTIRTDLSLAEHKEFLKRQFGIELAPDATVTDYVAAVGFLNARDNPGVDIADVVDTMRDTRFDMTGGSLQAYKNRLWQEVYRDLNNRDALWQFDTTTAKFVAEFADFIQSDNWTRREMEEALATTILRIAKHLRGDIITDKQKEERAYRSEYGGALLSYGAVYQDAQELEGCAGGGGAGDNPFRNVMRDLLRQSNPTRHLMQSITPRIGVSAIHTEDDMGKLEFDCPACNKTNKRPYGGFRDTCEHCGSDEVAC